MSKSKTPNPKSKIEGPVRRHALARPDAPALVTPGEAVSYAALDRRVTATARRLNEHALPERVALLLPSDAAHVVLLWALWRTGRVAAPLSVRTPTGGLSELLRAVGTEALLTRSDPDELPPAITTLSPDALLADGFASDAPVSFDADQPATAVFTSGSTGAPKAALHSLGNHYFSALGSKTNITLEPGDRWLLSLPLYHVGGLAIVMRCFEAGAAVALPAPDEAVTSDVLTERRVTHVSLVATQLRRLLARSTGDAPPPALQAVLLGGGPIPEALTDEAHERGWPVHTSYGLTETASQVTTTPPGASPDTLRTAGRLLPHRELRLADDGEIQVRGPVLFEGYLQNGTLRSAARDDGWFETGDRGAWTDDDLLRVTGRTDRMFVSGGENVQPEEIESALLKIESVERAVVVPAPDDEFGARPVAFVRGHLPAEALADRLEHVLPRFKVPEAFYDWPDDLAGGMKPDRPAFVRRARRLRSN